MPYNRLQKFLSGCIILFLLSNISIHIPLSSLTTFAGGSDFYNLVSIIVDEEVYSDLEDEIETYSRDISGVLENTKVVILPIDKNTTAFQIASLNEGLYFDGYNSIKKVDFESKLVGTVLVGDFPLPVASQSSNLAKTILPYTDFESKAYIYDPKTEYFEYNDKNTTKPQAEIWHGVLSPNTGDLGENQKALKGYFKKNHDFYTAQGLFSTSKEIIDGDINKQINAQYDPYVFYMDSIRDEKSLNIDLYKGYQGYLENKQDIVYNRFSKDLADKIKQKVLDGSQDEIKDLIQKIDPNITLPDSSFDITDVPDIHTRSVVTSATKTFLEIFSKGNTSKQRKDVHGAGRYNKMGSKVNTHMIPYLASVLDVVNDEIIKDVQSDLEEKINIFADSILSQDIIILEKVEEKKLQGNLENLGIYKDKPEETNSGSTTGDLGSILDEISGVTPEGEEEEEEEIDEEKLFALIDAGGLSYDDFPGKIYLNHFNGTKASDILGANQCSIYRGSTQSGGQLVEANRAFNHENSQKDLIYLQGLSPLDNPNDNSCSTSGGAGTLGVWGGNSPLNLGNTQSGLANASINNSNPGLALESIFDISGSKQSFDDSKIPSPLNCLGGNLLLMKDTFIDEEEEKQDDEEFEVNIAYQVPENGEYYKWSCSELTKSIGSPASYEELLTQVESKNIAQCEISSIYLDGDKIISQKSDASCEDTWSFKNYYYKSIPSVIYHVSPTPEETKAISKNGITPNLPIDKIRYVDFLQSDNTYVRIDYPNIFEITNDKNLSKEEINQKIATALQQTSSQINSLLTPEVRAKLQEEQSQTDGFLGTLKDLIGDGATTQTGGIDSILDNLSGVLQGTSSEDFSIDLLQYLENGSKQQINKGQSSTQINYFNTLGFAGYWNSLNSVSAKYAYIFENYLSDGSKENQGFGLPQNKALYEIAYLGAKGNASEMFIGLDPQSKQTDVHGDILSQNAKLDASLFASADSYANNYTSKRDQNEGIFKCAPPEGVDITEWVPAVFCWIENMLPPTITIGEGRCGYSLLSQKETDYIKTCNGDENKNGINDCNEKTLSSADVKIESSSQVYPHNSLVELTFNIFDKNKDQVRFINNLPVDFSITKIDEIANNKKTRVYDNKAHKKDILDKYVDFGNGKSQISSGVAQYSFTPKSKDLDIYISANLKQEDNKGKTKISLSASSFLIKVRGETLFIGGKTSTTSTLQASESSNVFIIDGSKFGDTPDIAEGTMLLDVARFNKNAKSIALAYPLRVQLFLNDIEQSSAKLTESQLRKSSGLFAIKKSGNYTVRVTDAQGLATNKKITVSAGKPKTLKIDFGSSYVQTGGGIATGLVTIFDAFQNPSAGKWYDIDMEILGNGISFHNTANKKVSFSTIEGYQAFRIRASDEGGKTPIKITLKDKNGKTLLSHKESISTITSPKAFLKTVGEDIKVGGNTYSLSLSLRSDSGAIMSDLNSRVYLGVNRNYLLPTKPYFEIKNGKATIEFTTGKTAIEDLDIALKIEGFSKTIDKKISILPDVPMKLSYNLHESKIAANPESQVILDVEYRDRFNNKVFSQNSGEITLDIPSISQSIISSDTNTKKISKGSTRFILQPTLLPGIGYFKLSSSVDLSKNSFQIEENNTKVVVEGVSQSAGKLETFYVWDKNKIDKKYFNALYTTLLGANYGDIQQKDYLAGALIFSPDNRALSVTSLLHNSQQKQPVVRVNKQGAIQVIQTNNLTQNISNFVKIVDNTLRVDFYNQALDQNLGELTYLLPKDLDFYNCDISSCGDSENPSLHILQQSNDYRVFKQPENIQIKTPSGKILLDINKNAEINTTANISLQLGEKSGNNFALDVYDSTILIAKITGKNFDITTNVSRSFDTYKQKVNAISSGAMFYVANNSYGTQKVNKDFELFYNDPFASNNTKDIFSKNNVDGYENFLTTPGIGWGGGNKTLLEFSSGKSVGEATKGYSSFGMINIGDPVISLKKIKQKLPKTILDRKFDRTIGRKVTNQRVEKFHVFDYNNDQIQDVLIVQKDNTLSLLENKSDKQNFLDKKELLSIADLGNLDHVKTGDFNGDGYGDIIFVNNKNKPFIFMNQQKNFIRKSLSDILDIKGGIVGLEVSDLDNDKVSDIVILDDSGEINIFYGSSFITEPSFNKLLLSSGHGVTLGAQTSNDEAAVYYDNMKTISITGTSDTNAEVKGSINNIIYDYIPYQTTSKTQPQIPESQAVGNNQAQDSYNSFIQNNEDSVVYTGEQVTIENKPFIRSQYANNVGLDIQRKLSGNNTTVKSGDIISAELSVTNTTNNTLRNIILLEKVPEIFAVKKSTIKSTKEIILGSPYKDYSFSIEQFSLSPGENIKITYQLQTKTLSYGHLQIGDFEAGKIGSDDIQDIILKTDNKNCGQAMKSFLSKGPRDYDQSEVEAQCGDNSNLPENIKKNTIDVDKNGVPDYIDALTSGSVEDIQSYAKTQLEDLYKDSDNDGLPDSEDLINSQGNIYEESDYNSFVADGNQALEGLNNVFEGLSCGFGGGACYSSPLNWAPLAPGNDPVFMGDFIGDGLNVDEGIPIFSAMTGINIPTPAGCYQAPAIFPASPFEYTGTCNTNLGAGGSLGVDSLTNNVRIFVTPTITGAVGTAICFGGPASVVGKSIPKGYAPLFPGGNCIVAAKPIIGCSNDGSEGNIGSMGYGDISNGNISSNGYNIINGNCGTGNSGYQSLRPKLSNDFVSDYIISAGNSPKLSPQFKNAQVDHSTSAPGDFSIGNENGLFYGSISSDDTASAEEFSDIIKIQNKRPSAFPSFIMDWVTRQTDEIVDKLTDFPTLIITLPDFDSMFQRDEWKRRSGNDIGNAVTLDNNISQDTTDIRNGVVDDLSRLTNKGGKKVTTGVETINTGVNEVYEYLASTPLVNIREEKIYVNIPWVNLNDLDKTIYEYEAKIEEYKVEILRASESWSLGETCDIGDEKCKNDNEIQNKIILDTRTTIASLEKNVDILKSYKDLPQDINDLINTKEKYLEQLLCNVEGISEITGGWINRNGERFKAWVDLYVLVKAILKSWQALIDIFIDYDATCNECKNERQDGLQSEFDVIGLLDIQIPVIQFPSWPDLELDLHNIRAGIDIALPSYHFNTRPIVFPELPNLRLPDVPTLAFHTPEIPLLPEIVLPDLPDLPSIPSIELPDLPPPPKLPKLFSQIEGVLDILKLITKAMCILKSSPFVPEWRAGDQIAFITERNGYLPFDFLNLDSPQFTFPWVDKIKVSSYVNLELETDFLVEMARQAVVPLDKFSSNNRDLFSHQYQDLDFQTPVPTTIDVNINSDGSTGNNLGSNRLDLIQALAGKLYDFTQKMNIDSQEMITSQEYLANMNKALSDKKIVSDPTFDNLRGIWSDVNQRTHSIEDAKIKELLQNNTQKFTQLENIVNTEIIKTKQEKHKWNNYGKSAFIFEVASQDNTKDIGEYNTSLEKYNKFSYDAAKKLLEPNKQNQELKVQAEAIKSSYKNIQTNTGLLGANTQTGGNNSCNQNTSSTQINYKGLYVVEKDISYRLFDYLDEVNGEEITKTIDIDNDNDEDLLYLSNGELFVKENLLNQEQASLQEEPLFVSRDNNKFLNTDIHFPTVNNIEVISSTSNGGDILFSADKNEDISNYRLELYTQIDKRAHLNDSNYFPSNTKKSITDVLSDTYNKTIIRSDTNSTLRKNIAYIQKLGNFKNINVSTQELKNIKYDIQAGKKAEISQGNTLYAGKNNFTISYLKINTTTPTRIRVDKYTNITFKEKIRIVGITGDAYIKTGKQINLKGSEIIPYVGKPIFNDFTLLYPDDNNQSNSYIEIEYYDSSRADISAKKVNKYTLKILNTRQKQYFINLNLAQDFFYGNIRSFAENIFSTGSKSFLIAPQKYSDTQAPDIEAFEIKIPVYQSKRIDIGEYIYENSGLLQIKQILIDMDLNTDSNRDGDSRNDGDIANKDIQHTSQYIWVNFPISTKLVHKQIGITLIDQNDNRVFKEIPFEIYAPRPEIQSVTNTSIQGEINEELDQEPVTLFRYRAGQLQELSDESGSTNIFTDVGEFNFTKEENTTGLTLQSSGTPIASIDEKTGKIFSLKPGYTIRVSPSGDKKNKFGYPKISIMKSATEIYYQYFVLKNSDTIIYINELSDFLDTNTQSEVGFKWIDNENYNSYTIPNNALINPGSIVIYRNGNTAKQPIFIIFPDGRIKTWNSDYIIKYNQAGEHVSFTLFDTLFKRDVGQVHLKINADYIMK